MDYEQMRAQAAVRSPYVTDGSCMKLYVSSLAGSPATAGIVERLRRDIDAKGLNMQVIAAGSTGLYDLEPIVTVERPGGPPVLYRNVTTESAGELLYGAAGGIPHNTELPQFALQDRIALGSCGRIDPASIDEYVLRGDGYTGLDRALHITSEEVITRLEKSGFATIDTWRTCRETEAEEKYVICNAVDGCPAARTAQLLIEGDPHRVLEGLLIAAYAVGASKAFICVDMEQPATISMLKTALEQSRNYGLTGECILDSAFSCDIELRGAPASPLIGEETALIRFLEGRQAMPYLRPPYPAVDGLHGSPTLIHDVETLAHVPGIMRNGAEQGRGTRVITLTGEAVRHRSVEVPLGTSLKSIITDIGCGDKGSIKAMQVGGPSGRYVAGNSLDTPIDREIIGKAGATGSGVIEVFPSGSCAVEMARNAMAYLQEQSCGKCVLCREGTYQALDILEDIAENRGKPGDIELLLELADGMKAGSICDFGRAAANPLLSSIALFRDDYDAHVNGKGCPANDNR